MKKLFKCLYTICWMLTGWAVWQTALYPDRVLGYLGLAVGCFGLVFGIQLLSRKPERQAPTWTMETVTLKKAPAGTEAINTLPIVTRRLADVKASHNYYEFHSPLGYIDE